MKLSPGTAAPSFEAVDQVGKTHRLEDYRGRWVLLYFYPKDNTPGCTKEACAFRDYFGELKAKVTILGVSADSQKSHQGFADKYNLPFPLLADPDRRIIQAYGTDGVVFPKRTSFLIGPDGSIHRIYEKVKPETHAQEILEEVSGLAV